MVPRLALILIFLCGSIFAYIESVYMRDHAAFLGDKSSSVVFWMWVYRAIAVASFFAASFFSGAFFRR